MNEYDNSQTWQFEKLAFFVFLGDSPWEVHFCMHSVYLFVICVFEMNAVQLSSLSYTS